MLHLLVVLLAGLCAASIGYTMFAAWAVTRVARRPGVRGAAEPVTLLKPLHGPEPLLGDNLRSFLAQDWTAPVQMIAGVADADDPAAAVAREIGATVVVGTSRHGANGKVSNLVNMMDAASHDLLVLSDSDMAVPADYLALVAGALADPGVGAVTCLYCGRGDAGRWSRLAAAGISYQFLPSVIVGLSLGLAKPCMGSTIALRRRTLEAIGGFGRFADQLADDYAIGAAVRALGTTVAVPPLVLDHGCTETSFGALWRHELRWARTIRTIDLPAHLGTIVLHPLPLTLALVAIAPATGLGFVAAAGLARLLLWRTVDRVVGRRSASPWLLPLRDGLSLAVFLTSFVARSVDWRGSALRMAGGGRILSRPEQTR